MNPGAFTHNIKESHPHPKLKLVNLVLMKVKSRQDWLRPKTVQADFAMYSVNASALTFQTKALNEQYALFVLNLPKLTD